MGTPQHPSDFSSYHMFSSTGRSPYDAFHVSFPPYPILLIETKNNKILNRNNPAILNLAIIYSRIFKSTDPSFPNNKFIFTKTVNRNLLVEKGIFRLNF